jgi:hypothetical protein
VTIKAEIAKRKPIDNSKIQDTANVEAQLELVAQTVSGNCHPDRSMLAGILEERSTDLMSLNVRPPQLALHNILVPARPLHSSPDKRNQRKKNCDRVQNGLKQVSGIHLATLL